MSAPPENASSYVFVSYASADRERVLPVVDSLARAGVSIWRDQDDITGGTSYGPAIAAAIRGSAAVIVLCSHHSLASRNVRQEIAIAWKHERSCLPLLLEPLDVLPAEVEYWLEGAQWIEVLEHPQTVWLPKVLSALGHPGMESDAAGTATRASEADALDLVPDERSTWNRLHQQLARSASEAPSEASAQPATLPDPLTTFVGREREIGELRVLLTRPGVRLVTITGPGGAGKTRLAIEATNAMVPDVVPTAMFVDLAPVDDPVRVPLAVATALGVRESASGSTEDAVLQFLRERQMLLLLDNFEQVVDAATFVSRLLRHAPGIVAIVTSRVPLRLQGERLYPAPPLDLPNPSRPPSSAKDLLRYDAVHLFVQRAMATRPTFQLTDDNARAVADICARLDGLPLAIELAAARVRHITPDAILTRLGRQLELLTGGPRDLPERQQTMQATIAWSYNLLAPEQQRLFRQMAVFVSGWELDAAQAVSDADLDVLDGLSALIDHNLIQHIEQPGGTNRYRMLEPIREFGWERLREAGEAGEAQQRLAAFITELVSTGEPPTYWSPIPDSWLQRCALELANIRASLDWYVKREPRGALRLASSLYWFWRMHGFLVEGSRWIEEALQNSPGAIPAERAKALTSLADLACWQSKLDQAAQLYEESHSLYVEIGDTDGIGRTRYGLARSVHFGGDFQLAQKRYEACMAFYDAIGDLNGYNSSRFNLAAVLSQTGDLDRAQRLYEQSQERFLQSGDHATIVTGYSNLAAVAARRENWPQLLTYTSAALQLYQTSVDLLHIIECIEYVGMVLAVTGQPERAARLWGAADTQRQRTGYPAIAPLQREVDELRATIERQLGSDAFAAAFAEGRSLPIDDVVADALAVEIPSVAPAIPGPAAGLSKRELEVLRLIVDGKTNQEIAAALFINPNTVMNHVASIFNKLGVDSRTAAATYAIRHNLV